MTDRDPQNRKDESFVRGAGAMFEQTLEWLRANGIDPHRVAADPNATMTDGEVTLIMKVPGPSGRGDVVAPEGNSVLMETRTFPVAVPPPPLVEKWLAPTCPTCGR